MISINATKLRPLRKLNAALYKSCAKAGFSAAFLRIFWKAVEKVRFFSDLRKSCTFFQIAAEKLYFYV